MTKEFIDFIKTHEDEDTARLLLSSARYPAIDMPLVVQQIEGRRTAREKWPSLLAYDDFLYPPRLNREQASSEATARYKADLTVGSNIAADLTGGMGIDSMILARSIEEIHYIEQNGQLCDIMRHNCIALGKGNVDVHQDDSLKWLKNEKRFFDLLYIDPSRRDAAGQRTVAFENCQPDILENLPLLMSRCTNTLMIKASPMIDINIATKQLKIVNEVHIVAVRGECKEVLFLCRGGLHRSDTEACKEPVINCVNIKNNDISYFQFTQSEEQGSEGRYCTTLGKYLYEPDATLMKGGPFKLLCQRYNLSQLARNTHLFTGNELLPHFPGRKFSVIAEVGLTRKEVRTWIPDGRVHVVTRNYPVASAELQHRLGLKEGGSLFIIATTVGSRKTGFICCLPGK